MASTLFVDYSQNTPIVAAWLNDVNNAVYDGNGNLNLQRVTDSIAALRTLSKSGSPNAFVTGYYAPCDGGGGPYKLIAQTQGSYVDNGGSTIVAADGGVWELNTPPDWWVEQFGAKGNGANDDQPAIQNAISALPAGGGYVRMNGKTYGMGRGLVVGTGNNGTVTSTKYGVRLIGMGCGNGIGPTPTVLQALDGGQTSPYIGAMLTTQGAIDGCVFEGFKIYCYGGHSSPTTGSLVTDGIVLNSFTGLVMRNVNVAFATNIGIYISGGGAPTGNYNIYNQFHQCTAVSTINNHVGLLMDGIYAVSNDTWLTSFFNCRFDTNSALNATAVYMKFCDSCSFYRCHMVGNNTNGVPMAGFTGLYMNAVGNPGFPSGMGFYDCSILSTFVNENSTDKIRAHTFVNYGTLDNEPIPIHPMLKGITDTGLVFNGWGQPFSTTASIQGQVIAEFFPAGTDAITPNNGIATTTWEYDLIAFNGGITQRLVGIAANGVVLYSSASDTKWVKLKRLT